MDFIDRIGPVLGIVAFLGLSALALLVIMQAREVRRLREWAGRAPERAAEADEATQAAAEARGELEEDERPGRIAALRERMSRRFRPAWEAADRNSPIDPRWLLLVVAALVIAAGVVTGGFGLLSDEDGRAGDGQKREAKAGGEDKPPEVAVLNATASDTGTITVEPVAGLAALVSDDVLDPAGYKVVAEETAASGVEDTTVMFEPGFEDQAATLAEDISAELGEPVVEPMIQEVRDLAKDAPLAVLVGSDNDEFGE